MLAATAPLGAPPGTRVAGGQTAAAAAARNESYRNREKARDALLAELRALAGEASEPPASGSGGSGGSGFGSSALRPPSVRARELVASVRPENIRWFAELVVARLAQAAAAGEADEELASAVTPARLARLHRRLTENAPPPPTAERRGESNASNTRGGGGGERQHHAHAHAHARGGAVDSGAGRSRGARDARSRVDRGGGGGGRGGGGGSSSFGTAVERSFACLFPPSVRPYVRLVEAADSHVLATAMTRALVAALHALDPHARPEASRRRGGKPRNRNRGDASGSSSGTSSDASGSSSGSSSDASGSSRSDAASGSSRASASSGFGPSDASSSDDASSGGSRSSPTSAAGPTERALAAAAVAGALGVLAFGAARGGGGGTLGGLGGFGRGGGGFESETSYAGAASLVGLPPGVDVLRSLRRSAASGDLLVTAPWALAFLRFSAWDADAFHAPEVLAPLAWLRAARDSGRLRPSPRRGPRRRDSIAAVSSSASAEKAESDESDESPARGAFAFGRAHLTLRAVLARGLDFVAPVTDAQCRAMQRRDAEARRRAAGGFYGGAPSGESGPRGGGANNTAVFSTQLCFQHGCVASLPLFGGGDVSLSSGGDLDDEERDPLGTHRDGEEHPGLLARDPSIGRGHRPSRPAATQLCAAVPPVAARARLPGAPELAAAARVPGRSSRRSATRGGRYGGKKKKSDPLARWGAGRDSAHGPSSTATAKAKGSAEGIAARPIRGDRAGATLGTDFAPDAADRRYLESTCPALEDAFVALEAARRAWPREREGGGGGEPNPSEPARGSGSGLDDEDARRTPAKTTTPAEIESADAPPRPETPARARAESLPNAPNTAPNTPNAAPNTPNAAPNTPNAAPNTPNAAGSFGAGSARRRRVTAVRTAATPTAATPATLSPRREGERGGGGADGGSGGRSSASDPRTPGGDGGAPSRAAPVEGDGDDAPNRRGSPDGPSSAAFRAPALSSSGRPPPPSSSSSDPAAARSSRESSTTRLRLRRAFLAPRPATRRAVDFAAEVAADAALEAATVAFLRRARVGGGGFGDELRGTSGELRETTPNVTSADELGALARADAALRAAAAEAAALAAGRTTSAVGQTLGSKNVSVSVSARDAWTPAFAHAVERAAMRAARECVPLVARRAANDAARRAKCAAEALLLPPKEDAKEDGAPQGAFAPRGGASALGGWDASARRDASVAAAFAADAARDSANERARTTLPFEVHEVVHARARAALASALADRATTSAAEAERAAEREATSNDQSDLTKKTSPQSSSADDDAAAETASVLPRLVVSASDASDAETAGRVAAMADALDALGKKAALYSDEQSAAAEERNALGGTASDLVAALRDAGDALRAAFDDEGVVEEVVEENGRFGTFGFGAFEKDDSTSTGVLSACANAIDGVAAALFAAPPRRVETLGALGAASPVVVGGLGAGRDAVWRAAVASAAKGVEAAARARAAAAVFPDSNRVFSQQKLDEGERETGDGGDDDDAAPLDAALSRAAMRALMRPARWAKALAAAPWAPFTQRRAEAFALDAAEAFLEAIEAGEALSGGGGAAAAASSRETSRSRRFGRCPLDGDAFAEAFEALARAVQTDPGIAPAGLAVVLRTGAGALERVAAAAAAGAEGKEPDAEAEAESESEAEAEARETTKESVRVEEARRRRRFRGAARLAAFVRARCVESGEGRTKRRVENAARALGIQARPGE